MVAEKPLTEKMSICINYKREKEGKNENLKKEGKISISIFEKEEKLRISILISIYTVHFAFLKMYTKFEKHLLQ